VVPDFQVFALPFRDTGVCLTQVELSSSSRILNSINLADS
jgi:hypothetical protein